MNEWTLVYLQLATILVLAVALGSLLGWVIWG